MPEWLKNIQHQTNRREIHGRPFGQQGETGSMENSLFARGQARNDRQIAFQNCHLKGVRNLAVFVVLEDHADEFVTDVNFGRIVLLRSVPYGNRIQPECIPKIFLKP